MCGECGDGDGALDWSQASPLSQRDLIVGLSDQDHFRIEALPSAQLSTKMCSSILKLSISFHVIQIPVKTL